MHDETLSVAEISSEQNISARSLNRAFAAEGTTPMAWLRNKRLAEAYALLKEGRSDSVTDTAFRCGFSDLSYFGRCFRKTYGMAPKQAMTRKH
jgi:AraC-like DNA-binding protein